MLPDDTNSNDFLCGPYSRVTSMSMFALFHNLFCSINMYVIVARLVAFCVGILPQLTKIRKSTSHDHVCSITPTSRGGHSVRWKLNGDTTHTSPVHYIHDDVIKWKHFPRYLPFVRGIHRFLVNSRHKGQWRGALNFSLIYAWTNGWVNNRKAGDLRRHHAQSDVTVM